MNVDVEPETSSSAAQGAGVLILYRALGSTPGVNLLFDSQRRQKIDQNMSLHFGYLLVHV